MIRKGILLFALLLFVESAKAYQRPLLQRLDTLTYNEWTLEDGLPVNSINSIEQDSLGYLWISTYDGLVRFDGLNFKTFDYSNTPEMPHNRATLLKIQEGVGIWIALEYGGVLLYKDGDFKHFGRENGFTDSDLTKIYETSDGRMFFITHQGLYVYADSLFSRYFDGPLEGQNQISGFFEDTDGSIWLATNNGLIHFKDDEINKQFHISDQQEKNRILFVHRNRHGILQLGTVNGLYEVQNGQLVSPERYQVLKGKTIHQIYEDNRVTLYTTPGAVYSDEGTRIRKLEDNTAKRLETYIKFYRDRDGVLWLIGNAGSLSILKNGHLAKFDPIDKIKDYHFNEVFEDREGNIWFSTNTKGLITIRKSKVRTIGMDEGLSGKNILALFEDSKGRYWVGTRGAGLNKIENNKITSYLRPEGLESNIVQSVGEDIEGNIWIGYHQDGVDRYKNGRFENFRLGNNLEINDVRAIFKDSNGQLWIGTYGGLIKFNPESDKHSVFGIEDGMAGYKVRYITEDQHGDLWIATLDGGVSRFHNGSFSNYTIENGLSSNNVRSIYIDEKEPGTVWIGTENNGLNRLRDGKIAFVSTQNGLPDHIIHWISQDNNGWLWASSNRGIFKINKSELNDFLDGKRANFTLLHYGRQEGMRNPEANGSFQEAGIRTDKGNFWFSTQEGVAIFESEIAQTNKVSPTVLIEKIRAGNYDYASTNVVIEKGFKTFDVYFHALTFVAPEKTRFRYRLKGYDEDWIEVSGKRMASYAEVPAGDYTFEVLAANNDGVWSKNPATAMITVQPFFYEQAWFFILIVLLVGTGYYTASQVRYRYLVHKQEQMQTIIEEQTAQLRKEKRDIEEKNKIIRQQAEELEESNKTKDKFFSLIAHDLRNPFQAILGYSEMMITEVEEADPGELKAGLEHIHTSSKSLLTLVEHLLNWASLHTGKISPDPEKVNLREIIERTHQLFEHVANQKNIHLQNKADEDAFLLADLNMVETILRNLVSNAIKFTHEDGTIILDLHWDEDYYFIEVEDNGMGMSKKMADKLLRLDSNTSRAGTRDEQGTGLGLLICKEMMNLHNGEILVESEEGKGTRFTLKFPTEGLSDHQDRIEKRDPD